MILEALIYEKSTPDEAKECFLKIFSQNSYEISKKRNCVKYFFKDLLVLCGPIYNIKTVGEMIDEYLDNKKSLEIDEESFKQLYKTIQSCRNKNPNEFNQLILEIGRLSAFMRLANDDDDEMDIRAQQKGMKKSIHKVTNQIRLIAKGDRDVQKALEFLKDAVLLMDLWHNYRCQIISAGVGCVVGIGIGVYFEMSAGALVGFGLGGAVIGVLLALYFSKS